jgi:hypothetical protein
MALDARSLAFTVGDARILILLALGYISSIGLTYLLCTSLSKKIPNQTGIKSTIVVAGSEYAVSFLIGSALWYGLLAYPTLLWIPISLFLIISLGATV